MCECVLFGILVQMSITIAFTCKSLSKNCDKQARKPIALLYYILISYNFKYLYLNALHGALGEKLV